MCVRPLYCMSLLVVAPVLEEKKLKDVSCKVLSQDMKGNDLCLLCPRSVTDMVQLSVSNLNINAVLRRTAFHRGSHTRIAMLFFCVCVQNLDPTKETPSKLF